MVIIMADRCIALKILRITVSLNLHAAIAYAPAIGQPNPVLEWDEHWQ
jgi:hypothetical protein